MRQRGKHCGRASRYFFARLCIAATGENEGLARLLRNVHHHRGEFFCPHAKPLFEVGQFYPQRLGRLRVFRKIRRNPL